MLEGEARVERPGRSLTIGPGELIGEIEVLDPGGGRIADIHAVGPVWHGGSRQEAETLASAYRASIALAAENGVRVLALPSISTGAYGYPVDQAAAIALGVGRDALLAGTSVGVLRWVLFSAADLQTYAHALAALPR